jgi:dTDP-D-glucose 4,6-dehydratase
MADLKRATSLLNWRPTTQFEDGLDPTIKWYVTNRDPAFVRNNLDRLLFERDAVPDKGWD